MIGDFGRQNDSKRSLYWRDSTSTERRRNEAIKAHSRRKYRLAQKVIEILQIKRVFFKDPRMIMTLL